MKPLIILSAAIILAAPAAFAIDYSAVPQTGKVSKSPPGSSVTIQGTNKFGTEYENVFKVQPDGSMKLVNQYSINTN